MLKIPLVSLAAAATAAESKPVQNARMGVGEVSNPEKEGSSSVKLSYQVKRILGRT